MKKEFKILVLDDMAERRRFFRSCSIGFSFFEASNATEAITLLNAHDFGQIFLDHDLSEEHYLEGYKDPDNPIGKYDNETGYAVAKWLAENPESSQNAEIVVHTQNHWGGTRMLKLLYEAGREVRYIPYCDLVTKIKKRPDWQYPRKNN